MSCKKIKLGIVGCSNRIKGLLQQLPGLGENIEIYGLFDPYNQKTEDWQQELKCNNLHQFDSYQELLKQKEIEWVVISSWNAFHARQAVDALKAGKHVFCEKPLATNIEDAALLNETARNSDRIFLVGFTLRYLSFYRALKEAVDSGMIGQVISMEFNETLNFNHGGYIMAGWRRLEKFTGTHILEKCCHDMDIANWLLSSRASRVASFGGRNFFIPENAHLTETLPPDQNGDKAYCQWPGVKGKNPFLTEKDIVDNQVVILEYTNQVRATFHTNLNSGIPERRFYILGSRGALRGDVGDVRDYRIEFTQIGFDAKREVIFSETPEPGGHAGADSVLCRHWADLMTGKESKALSTVKNGLESAVTCFGIEESRKTGKVVDMGSYWKQLDK